MQHLRAARERNERAILPSEAGTSDDEGTVSEKDKEKDRGTTRASE
jgi:hypothetical protein